MGYPTDRYTQRLDTDYQAPQNQEPKPYEPPKSATGKSVYDIQRERVQADAERQKKQYSDALKRRMSAQGIQQGGADEKAQRNLAVEMAKARAIGMSEVDVAELQAQDQARQQREARDFALQERLGTQAFQGEQAEAQRGFSREQLAQQGSQFGEQLGFQREQLGQQRELTLGDLSLREQQLAEQGRQFNSEDDFKRYALGLNMTESEAQRAWQANQNELGREQESSQFGQTLGLQTEELRQRERLSLADLSLKEQQMQQQASQFATEDEFKRYALSQDMTEAEAGRVWQATQNGLERQQKGEMFYADLNQQERELSQQAEQFGTEQEFKTWATQVGIDDNAANRVWQATQNEADRTQQESQFGQAQTLEREKLQAQVDQTAAELAEKQRQFDGSTGLEREKLAQDLDVLQKQYDYENALNRQQLGMQQTLSTQEFDQQKTLMETELAEKQRQFDASTGLEKDRLAQELDVLQKEYDYQNKLNEQQLFMESELSTQNYEQQAALLETEIAEKQRQFDASTGLERERLAQDLEELNMEYNFQTKLAEQALYSEMAVTRLKTDEQMEIDGNLASLAMDKLDYQNEIEKKNQIDEASAKAWYNRGVSGEPLTQAQNDYLQNNFPLYYASYKDGQSGISAADSELNLNARQAYFDARITNLSTYEGDEFNQQLSSIYTDMGMTPPAILGTGVDGNTDEMTKRILELERQLSNQSTSSDPYAGTEFDEDTMSG